MRWFLNILIVLPCLAIAQDFPSALQRDLDTYYQSHLPLKIQIFTSQSHYAPGDTIFFKAYLITAQKNRPIAGKSVLKVNLLNVNDQLIQSHGFAMMNGEGSNQITIPGNIPSGEYYVEVKSDWLVGHSYIPTKKYISIGAKEHQRVIRAGAEGGILVAGLKTKLVVFAEPMAKGILKENGFVIQQFETSADGFAWMYLQPKAQARYSVEVNKESVFLPEVQQDGIGIFFSRMKDKPSKVYLSAPASSAFRDQTLHLVVSKDGNIIQSADLLFRNQTLLVTDILTDKIPPGIAQITVFDSGRNVLAERLIFNGNNDRVDARITMTDTVYRTRQRVSFDIDVLDGASLTDGKVAISIASTDALQTSGKFANSRNSDVLIFNDIGYDDYSYIATDAMDAVDSRLILAKWKRFDWRNLSKRADGEFYSPYMRFKGNAFNFQNNEPLPDSTKITFFFHKNVNIYETYTAGSGKFTVYMLFDFFKEDEVFYVAEYKGQRINQARIAIEAPDLIELSEGTGSSAPNAYVKFVQDRNEINTSYSYHQRTASSVTPSGGNAYLEEEVFGPDVEIKLGDYQLFPTMAETLKEVIPYAQHRKIRGQDVVKIYNPDAKDFWKENPVYVIDGVMTDDTHYFLSLNPAEVESIKLLYSFDKLQMFGAIGKGGIFIVETKIADNALNVIRSERSFTMTGLTEPLQPKIIAHENGFTNRIPDLRTNLLWAPNVEITKGKASLTFYTSDVPGTYNIMAQGITTSGKLFEISGQFEVKFKR